MLKQRIITAIILGLLIVFAIFKLPSLYIAILFAGVTLLGAWEWANLIGANTLLKKCLYIVLIGFLIAAIWFYASPALEKIILLVASLWWAGVVCLLSLYRSDWLQSKNLQKLLAYSGIIVLVPAWLGLIKLHHDNSSLSWNSNIINRCAFVALLCNFVRANCLDIGGR